MLTVRELIQIAYTAGLRNALPDDDSFSIQTRTRALYIGLMPDAQTGDPVTYASLFYGDAGATPIDDMINLVLRFDAPTEMFLLEIQPESGDAPDELIAYARELGLEKPDEALGLDEQRARLVAHRMIANVRHSFVPALDHECV